MSYFIKIFRILKGDFMKSPKSIKVLMLILLFFSVTIGFYGCSLPIKQQLTNEYDALYLVSKEYYSTHKMLIDNNSKYKLPLASFNLRVDALNTKLSILAKKIGKDFKPFKQLEK